jgi:hypothetical protein
MVQEEKWERESSIPVDRLVPIHISGVELKMLRAHMDGGRDPADGGWRSSTVVWAAKEEDDGPRYVEREKKKKEEEEMSSVSRPTCSWTR